MERAGAPDIEGEATRVGVNKSGGERVSIKGGSRIVKAIRVKEFGGPEVLQLEEVPTPQPGPGEVLVRIHAAGVNPVETTFAPERTRDCQSCHTHRGTTARAWSNRSAWM